MMVDPQFGIARLLRPFAGFETAYDGQTTIAHPIMFTEGGEALDPQAGQEGYSPNLLKGLSTAIGQRVQIWLPRIFGGTSPNIYPYRYEFTWRMRTVFDNAQERIPFHLRKQGAGIIDGGARVIIPAAVQTVVYPESPEPAFASTSVPNANLRSERVRVEVNEWSLPFIEPTGANFGHYQQGLYPPAFDPLIAYAPLFGVYDMHALGDELLIGVTRATDSLAGGAPVPNWTFASTDLNFSRLFGSALGTFEDIGIYVLVGTAP